MEDFIINIMSDRNNVKLFLEKIYMNYLFPMILRPNRITHKSFSLIDNIFINNPLTTESGLIISDISDHLPVFVILPCDTTISNNTQHVYNKRYLPQHCLHKLSKKLEVEDWFFIQNNTTVNYDFRKFMNISLNKYFLVSKLKTCKVKPKKP